MAITFNSRTDFKLKKTGAIRSWIKTVIQKEKKLTGDINYIFLNDEALLKMNQEYLQHNTFTDIITFDYSENKKISGDIFISVERVEENARKFRVDFEEELKRVMIHGVLHLCGYKDKSKKDAEMMRKKENNALRILQIK
jgi:probable rRNA maturation factor